MSESLTTGTDELLCSIDQRVATVTLNRPEKRNALSDNLTPALRQTLLELETRNDVGCIQTLTHRVPLRSFYTMPFSFR